MLKKVFSKKSIDTSFRISLIIKGTFDFGEIVGGIFMLFLSPEKLSRLIEIISRKELLEDPTDFLMNYLVTYSHAFSFSTQHFTSFYLLSHGIVKVVTLLLLWYKKLWAYPVSCIVFFAFIVFQMQRFTQTHSVMLLALTLLDVVMIILTVLEYRNIRQRDVS